MDTTICIKGIMESCSLTVWKQGGMLSLQEHYRYLDRYFPMVQVRIPLWNQSGQCVSAASSKTEEFSVQVFAYQISILQWEY